MEANLLKRLLATFSLQFIKTGFLHNYMKTSDFYLIYLILYIPFGKLFYEYLNIQWSDELLSVILGLYFILKSTHKGKLYISKELTFFIAIVLFYIIYSILLHKVLIQAILFDVLQQFKPYITFYATLFLKPQFSDKQSKFLRIYIISIFFTYVIISIIINRVFDIASFGQSCLICSFMYWYFSKDTKQNMIIIITMMTIGLLCFKSKYYGEYIIFFTLLFFIHKRLQLRSPKTFIALILLGCIILFFTWEKFNIYYVSGFQESQNGSGLARPVSYLTAIKILNDYCPFGSGLGSFSVEAARAFYSPLYYEYQIDHVWGLSPDNPAFLADAFYPSLAEIGFVGILFFFLFWKKRYKELNSIHDLKFYKIGLICFCALLLENIADTAYLSGAGISYFMFLALCINKK